MKDFLSAFLKSVDRYRYTFIGGLLAVILIGASIGCHSETASLFGTGDKVTSQGLIIEVTKITGDLASEKIALDSAIKQYNNKVTVFNAQIEAAQADIEKQDEVRTELFNIAGSVVTAYASGGVNAAAVVGTGITALGLLLGVGASVDNRRKDKKIKSLKNVAVTTGSGGKIELDT